MQVISEALDQAGERVMMYAERHDRILDEMCSSNLANQNLEDALAAARDAMDKASELAIVLGKLQLETIISYS